MVIPCRDAQYAAVLIHKGRCGCKVTEEIWRNFQIFFQEYQARGLEAYKEQLQQHLVMMTQPAVSVSQAVAFGCVPDILDDLDRCCKLEGGGVQQRRLVVAVNRYKERELHLIVWIAAPMSACTAAKHKASAQEGRVRQH
jgi:hypothetical protein